MKITQICRILNDEGIMTPSVYLAPIRGKYKTRPIWTYESIRNILTNRIYTGDTVPFKSHVVRVGSDRVKQISECDQIVIQDTHEAIISREMYFLAKNVVNSNTKSHGKGKSSVLSSYLVCGCCGNRLVKGKRTNKSFLCTSARYQTEGDCKTIRCNDEKMKAMLLRAIQQQVALMDTNIQLIKSVAKAQKREADAIRNGLRLQRRRVEGALSAKMALYEEYVTGAYTKEAYLERKLKMDEQEKMAKSQIASLEDLETRLNEKETLTDSLDVGVKLVNKYIGITELDDEIMRDLVRKIIVYPDSSIHIEWNFKDLTEQLRSVGTSAV